MANAVRGFYKDAKKNTRPLTAKVSSVGREASRVENKARRGLLQIKKRTRRLSKEQRQKLRTLENPLLYHKLKTILTKLNPEFDEALIDKSLEFGEAMNDLVKKVQGLVTRDVDISRMNMQEMRHYLSDKYDIDNTHVQNLVIMANPPLTEEELGSLSFALHGRSVHAKITDRAKQAPIAKTARQAMHINRYDIRGFDTKGVRTDISEKI